jgi:hypothetical protein
LPTSYPGTRPGYEVAVLPPPARQAMLIRTRRFFRRNFSYISVFF